MNNLDKSAFFNVGCRTATVDVPEFGTVTVRALTGEEFDKYQAAAAIVENGAVVGFSPNSALLVRLGVIGEDKQPVFSDDDLPRLSMLPASRLKPIAEKVMSLTTEAGKG